MAVQQKEEEEKKAKAAADAQNAQSQQTADQLGKFLYKIIKLTTAVKKFSKNFSIHWDYRLQELSNTWASA